jgi:hypothetical protein
MSRHGVPESAIIDVLLGQAERETEEEVLSTVHADPEFATLFEQWSEIFAVMKRDCTRAEMMTQRACVELPERLKVASASEGASISWTLTKAGVVLVACAAVAIVAWFGLGEPSVAPSFEEVAAPVFEPEETATYLVFSHEGPGKRQLGTESEPFRVLRDAVDAVSPGGTLLIKAGVERSSTVETVRIKKAMRIEAKGSSVRIGGPVDAGRGTS